MLREQSAPLSGGQVGLLLGVFGLLAWVPLPFVGDFAGVIDFRHNLVLPAAARDAIVEYGQLPLWNPYAKGGFSLIGAMEDGTLFPTFGLVLLFDVFVAAIIDYILFTAVGALGLMLLARRLGASLSASLLPALAFVFSNTMPVYLLGGWGMHLTMALIPLGIWLFLGQGRRYDVGLGVLLALFFLRGGMYPLAYLIGILALLAGWQAATARSGRPLARFCGVGVLALLLAAVKVAPALWSGDLGMPRGEEGYCFTLEGAFVGLTTWVLNGSLFEGCGAVGPVVVGLGVLGAATRRRGLGGLALCAAVLLVYALGSNLSPGRWFGGSNQMHLCAAGPSLHDLVEHLPLFGALWNPSRALVPLGMLVAVVAALGLDQVAAGIASRVPERWRAQARAAVVALICLAVAVPSFLESRTYLYRHMSALQAPRAPAAAEPFRQAEVCRVNDAYCPLLKRGSARGPILPFHTPAEALRVESDPNYLAEEYWLGDSGAVELVEWTPNKLTYRVTGDGAGRVVVNQNFKTGWHAEGAITGDAESYQGLLSVTAQGPGEVVFFYRPMALSIGLGLTLMGLGLAVVWWRGGRASAEVG